MADTTALIKVKDVSQTFLAGKEQVRAVKEASFEIQPNTFNIVYGPSGSGKTTLLNTLVGLQKPTSGQVILQDKDVYKLNSDELAALRANKIGIVLQTNYWVNSLNVLDNISLPLLFLGYNRKAANNIAKMSLERAKMTAYAKKYPTYLSGGEQQRVAIARALANDPLFIVTDEPTGNLDTANGDAVMELLQNIKDEYRRTVILVTHNMEYLPLADKILHIQDGIVEELASDNIQEKTDKLIEDIRKRTTYFKNLNLGSKAISRSV